MINMELSDRISIPALGLGLPTSYEETRSVAALSGINVVDIKNGGMPNGKTMTNVSNLTFASHRRMTLTTFTLLRLPMNTIPRDSTF